MTAAEHALRLVNVALEPFGLVVRTYAWERAKLAEINLILAGYWQAAERARRHSLAARDHANRAVSRCDRLRRHLAELDELVEGRGGIPVDRRSALTLAARRVIDVALGRDVERAA